MKNILIIPHTSLMNIKVRALEIAKKLAKDNNVYYLTWNTTEKSDRISLYKYSIKELLKITKLYKKNNITFIKTSLLFKPAFISLIYNENRIKELIKKFNIDTVINSMWMFIPVPRSHNIKYIYDIVDNPIKKDPGVWDRQVFSFVKNECSKANNITVCSSSLKEHINSITNRNAIIIPNGTDTNSFLSKDDPKIVKILKKHNIEKYKIIGFIGNHESFSGLEFLLNVFEKLSKKRNDIALLIAGPGSEVKRLKNRMLNMKRVFNIGPIPPKKVNLYFSAIDVGVLPFEISQLTNEAFPIKIIEYLAAKKNVIASPLTELKKLNFKGVFLTERTIEKWETILNDILNNKYETADINKYSWKKIANTFITL